MIDFTLLDPAFASKAQQLVQEMKDDGYDIYPYYGLRTVQEQAKLWRQSRSSAVINKQINLFRENGCDFLADVLNDVGAQNGAWATNALPGYSWHNWSQAMDCLITDGTHADYGVYADTARDLGLTAGYYFSHYDGVHVQLSEYEIPHLYTMKEINDHFSVINPV